jgi:hypothetical protein
MGKPSINGQFSMAMLNNQMVIVISGVLLEFNSAIEYSLELTVLVYI